MRRIREYNNTLPFISRIYNPAGMPVAANPDKLILITTANADAAMDVEALAGAFNINKAEVNNRKIVIPERYFGIEGVQAILTTSDFFVVADNLIETTSQFNPAKLTTNYWLHHWQVMSASRFAPLVMFSSSRESTVITTTPTPVTSISAFTIKDKAGNTAATQVLRGVLYDVVVEGVTTPASTDPAALDLDLSGHTSQFSYLSNHGDLYLGPDETADTITLTATSIDNGFTTTTTRTVSGAQVIPWPNTTVQLDIDLDNLEEVTPAVPTFKANVITIPKVNGVLYKNGATSLTDGQKITVAVGTPVTITATAKAGKELTTGAPASWVFTAV
jgi:hypothetical protein